MNENELPFLLSHLATGCLVVAGYLKTSGVVVQYDCQRSVTRVTFTILCVHYSAVTLELQT